MAGKSIVYAPVPLPREAGRDPCAALPGGGPAIAAWRERMGRDEAKAIYRQRAATAECVNALARNRGLLEKFTDSERAAVVPPQGGFRLQI